MIAQIRAVARLPPGEPDHRCRELLRRSAQSDATDGDTEPLQERLERTLKSSPAESIGIHALLVMNPRDHRSSVTVSIALEVVKCFTKKVFFSHNEINNRP